LVAAGLSNNQIADALTLSVRTVEGHIYHICTKLGLTGRSDLAHLISQLAPPGVPHPPRDGLDAGPAIAATKLDTHDKRYRPHC
jgi:hypothetical protein